MSDDEPINAAELMQFAAVGFEHAIEDALVMLFGTQEEGIAFMTKCQQDPMRLSLATMTQASVAKHLVGLVLRNGWSEETLRPWLADLMQRNLPFAMHEAEFQLQAVLDTLDEDAA